MDSNGDDKVDRDEMMAYLDPRHKQHALKEAEYLMRSSDRNMDGNISEHEMLMSYSVFTGSSFSNFAQVLHDEFWIVYLDYMITELPRSSWLF